MFENCVSLGGTDVKGSIIGTTKDTRKRMYLRTLSHSPPEEGKTEKKIRVAFWLKGTEKN